MKNSVKNKKKTHKKIHFFGVNVKAFSSLELILIIAIVTVIGLTSVPFLSRFFVQSATSDTYNRLLGGFRAAQTNAILGKQNGPWGVYYGIVNGSKEVILYQGTSYATHTNKAFDQAYVVNPNVTITGFSDINFSQVSGIPNTSTTITITAIGNTTKTIQIDSHGIVNYAPAGPTNTPAPTPTVTPTPRPTNTPTPMPTPTLTPTPTPFTTTVTNLHVTSVGTTTIGIAWNASPRATNYQVRVTYQSQVIDTEFTSGATNWTVTGLTNNQTYGLHVAAIDDTYWAPEASISQKTNL